MRILAYILIGITILVGAFTFVCYRHIQRFVGPCDAVVEYGKRSELAAHIRENIITQYGAQPFLFPTADGLTLQGLFIKREHARTNVILCHGYRRDKEFMRDFIPMFLDANIVLFDFRAHGQSEGKLITFGYHEAADVVMATEWLQRHTSKELPVVLVGVSMGGGAILRAAALNPGLYSALIVDSAVAHFRRKVENVLRKHSLCRYPIYTMMEYLFFYHAGCSIDDIDALQSAQVVTEPVLFITSEVDNVVDPQNTHHLYEASVSRYKKLWVAPPAEHARLHREYPRQYEAQVQKFLDEARVALRSRHEQHHVKSSAKQSTQ